jgi:DNA-binding transcriptional ArsR family regulator
MYPEPQLERIGAAMADISRKRMLSALMDGRAHTGKELAICAGIAPSTASGHLDRLRDARLVVSVKSGRSTYHRLAGPEVASALEGLAVLVPASFAARLNAAQRADPGCLQARCCYDHIAGALGVDLCAALVRVGAVAIAAEGIVQAGPSPAALVQVAGIAPLPGTAIGRTCLDWSERQPHLSGVLGRAMLTHWQGMGWLRRHDRGRALDLTPEGRQILANLEPPEGSALAKALQPPQGVMSA